jgi:hypothetical protein
VKPSRSNPGGHLDRPFLSGPRVSCSKVKRKGDNTPVSAHSRGTSSSVATYTDSRYDMATNMCASTLYSCIDCALM